MPPTPLNKLIGIPWGFDAGQTNCVDLMYAYAGKENPWTYDKANYLEESAKICERILHVMHPVIDVAEGVVAIIKIGACYHVVTFVDRMHILHVFEGQCSRISSYSAAYRKRTVGLYCWKGDALWLVQ